MTAKKSHEADHELSAAGRCVVISLRANARPAAAAAIIKRGGKIHNDAIPSRTRRAPSYRKEVEQLPGLSIAGQRRAQGGRVAGVNAEHEKAVLGAHEIVWATSQPAQRIWGAGQLGPPATIKLGRIFLVRCIATVFWWLGGCAITQEF